MKNLLVSCVFVFVLFISMPSFGGFISNNLASEKVSQLSSGNPYFGAAITAGIFVGALAVNYIWTYSNIFGVDASSDKGLDIDVDKRFREELLDELTKEDAPRDKRRFFEGPKNHEEGKLKKKSEKYWRKQYGYDLSKELEKDMKSLENKDSRAEKRYAHIIDPEKETFPAGKDETDNLIDDGYNRNDRRKVTLFEGMSSLGKKSDGSNGQSSGVTVADGGNDNSATSSESEIRQEDKFLALATCFGDMDSRINLLEQNLVKKLEIACDCEYSVEVRDRIFEALKRNRSVQELRIEGELLNGWDVFLANLLREGPPFSLRELYFCSVTISDDLGGAVAEFLKVTNSLELLDIFDALVEKQGLVEIVESLKMNSSLRELSFDDCSLHKEAITKLGEVFLVNNKLEKLTFNKIRVFSEDENYYESLDGNILIPLVESLKLNKGLRRFDFVSEDHPKLSDEFITVLASTLRVNETLQFLRIDNLGFGEEATVLLMDALRGNSTLRKLMTYRLDEKEIRILAEYLKGDGFLQQIFISGVSDEDGSILAGALEENDFLRLFSCDGGYLDDPVYYVDDFESENFEILGEECLEEALRKNVSLRLVPGSTSPLVANLLSINVFLKEQLLDAEVSELREKKVAMMRFWGDRNLADVDEEVFSEEIKLIFGILKMEEEIEVGSLTKGQFKKMLKEMSSIFSKVFIGDDASNVDKLFLASKMFWMYKSAISALNEVVDMPGVEKEKLENKYKEMTIYLLTYLYGSCLKFSIEDRGDFDVDGHKRSLLIVRDTDVVVGGLSADDYKRLLSTALVEYVLGKDEWQSWEEHFANKGTRVMILKYFVEVILHRKKAASSYAKGIDPFFDAGIVALQRVLFDLFGEEEAETVIEFKKKEEAVTDEELMVYVDGFYPNGDHFSDCEQFTESVLKLERSLNSLVNRVSQDGVDISNKEEIKEAAEMLLNLTRSLRDLCAYC